MLKCKADAEDIVQDTIIRWLHIEQSTIENTKAYLTTAVTNNCINHLKTLRKKKEEYWDHIKLSDWVQKFKEHDFSHLDIELELKDAFKKIHHSLEPLERAVFLLKDVFDFDYPSLQEIFDKKADHCRQLICRARKKLANETVGAKEPNEEQHQSLFNSFKKACQNGVNPDFIADLKKEIISWTSSKK